MLGSYVGSIWNCKKLQIHAILAILSVLAATGCC